MQVFSLIWGILALLGLLIGFVPPWGALNWVNIPFAIIGVMISSAALGRSRDEPKAMSIAGLACCMIAVIVGIFRLVVGAGGM
jgi:hypothetical protein